MWLGRLDRQTIPVVGAGPGGPKGDIASPRIKAAEAAPHSRTQSQPIPAEPQAVPFPNAAMLTTGGWEDQLGPETALALSPLSPNGPPTPLGTLATGSLTATSVPHLAAGIATTLHHRADGTTEIALSPEELGGVRLRLEADVQDPERVVVHLAFDRPETMDLFRRHADQLAEAIRAAGYAEARLDFGQAGTGPEAGNGQGSADDLGKAAAALPANATDPGLAPDRPFPIRPAGTAGLDLRL